MKTSCNIASPDFLLQVERIEASDAGPCVRHMKYRPCRLLLKDGTVVPRAICAEDHRGFDGKWWIHPNAVARIEMTLERLPAHLASKLYAAGESGMGYQVFRARMSDGACYTFLTGNVVEFPDFPEGYDTNDVQEVYPHEGREELILRKSHDFEWCFYVKD